MGRFIGAAIAVALIVGMFALANMLVLALMPLVGSALPVVGLASLLILVFRLGKESA